MYSLKVNLLYRCKNQYTSYTYMLFEVMLLNVNVNVYYCLF